MSPKLLLHKTTLAISSGLFLVLAFAPIDFWPAAFLAGIALALLPFKVPNFKKALWYGFVASLVIQFGAFYWVNYVVKVFGYMPWIAAFGVFLGFCLIGAVNFPVYVGVAHFFQHRIRPLERPLWYQGLWFTVALPFLFVATEWAVPKLFPWYAGHAFYKNLYVIQISEIVGSLFMSFLLLSFGGGIAHVILAKENGSPIHRFTWGIPALLWTMTLIFGAYRINAPPIETTPVRFALVQGNIGNLDKADAERGLFSTQRYIFERYKSLSEHAINHIPQPDILVWPETAMPFFLDHYGSYSDELKATVARWKTPLVTGGFARSKLHPGQDHNAAYLLEPDPAGEKPLHMEIYPKNVLLAFGEYMPFGEMFPSLYRTFPQVSHFDRGRGQQVFTLSNGMRLGITVCYEDIIPDFVRKVAALGANIHVNITNDSWFGPTSEPYQHGQLTIFRAVETRLPMVRTTNTGISFSVDRFGRMSETTKVYEQEILHVVIDAPKEHPMTFFTRFGDWFLIPLAAIFLALVVIALMTRHASVPL